MDTKSLTKSERKSVGNRPKLRRDALSMQRRVFFIIFIPYLLVNLLVKGLPFLWGIFISFTNYNGFNLNNLKMMGFSNFSRIFTDSDTLAALGRSFLLMLTIVPLGLVICLSISLLLNNIVRGKAVFRTICYIPSIVPAVAISMIWLGMYNKTNGMLNAVLGMLGIHAVDWLDYDHIRASLVTMMCWSSCGGILVNLASMKSIPTELYEAADIEGAGFFRKTFRITLPLMSNMIYMNLLTSMIGVLQMFGEPVLLSSAGAAKLTALPKTPVYTYLVHVYQQIFVNLRFGYGLSMVWIMFIVIMILTVAMEKGSKLWVYNEVD